MNAQQAVSMPPAAESVAVTPVTFAMLSTPAQPAADEALNPASAKGAETAANTLAQGAAFASSLNPESTSSTSAISPVFGPQQSTSPAGPKQQPADAPDKRILGIIPNYRSVAVGAKLPPQSFKEKLTTSLQDTFDIGAFELAVLISLEEYVTVATPEFHRGAVAYGRYFWHAFADQSIENELVEFVVPAIAHEDTRYYTLGTGGFTKRATYSLTRILIVRTDSGHESVNFGEIVGAGAAAGISSLYYPSSQRTAGKILDQYALNLGIDAASFVVREFDQDLTHVFRHKHDSVQTAPAP